MWSLFFFFWTQYKNFLKHKIKREVAKKLFFFVFSSLPKLKMELNNLNELYAVFFVLLFLQHVNLLVDRKIIRKQKRQNLWTEFGFFFSLFEQKTKILEERKTSMKMHRKKKQQQNFGGPKMQNLYVSYSQKRRGFQKYKMLHGLLFVLFLKRRQDKDKLKSFFSLSFFGWFCKTFFCLFLTSKQLIDRSSYEWKHISFTPQSKALIFYFRHQNKFDSNFWKVVWQKRKLISQVKIYCVFTQTYIFNFISMQFSLSVFHTIFQSLSQIFFFISRYIKSELSDWRVNHIFFIFTRICEKVQKMLSSYDNPGEIRCFFSWVGGGIK